MQKRTSRGADRTDGTNSRYADLLYSNAIDSINGHHHHPEWNFNVVKLATRWISATANSSFLSKHHAALAGQHDDLPDRRRGAVQNDAFGQHYCDEHLFNDEVDQRSFSSSASVTTPIS